VAAEFALVAADRPKVEELAGQGQRRARGLLAALGSLSFQLSGAQLGITVTALLVGFIVGPTLGEALAPILEGFGLSQESALGLAVTLALLFATAIQMVLGELIPKNLAVARPLGVGFAVVNPLRLLNASLRPVIMFLNASANFTVRRLGIEPREELRGLRSLDELGLLIRSSRRGGVLPEEEFSLLARSISFRDKTTGDALMPRTAMIAIGCDATVADAVRMALETGHSRFPVTGEGLDDVVGILYVKDVHRVRPEDRAATRVAGIMQEPLLVPESRPLPSLLSEMRRERKHLAVVLDEYGGTAGMVTLEDLLEEIVGDIEDEYDPASAVGDEAATPTGTYMLPGLLHRDEVLDAAGLELPEGDYDTLAGFMLTELDRIPKVGDRITFEGWSLAIAGMDRHRIAQVAAVAPAVAESSGEAGP